MEAHPTGGNCFGPERDPRSWRLLTVLTVYSPPVRMLIILVPARPPRENVTSMPSVRRNVCARRSRPASARGFVGQSPLPLEMPSLLRSAPARRRSAALPVHELRSAIMSRTRAATGSASMMPSMYEVISAREIEERIERRNRPTLLRHRQRQHAGRPPEASSVLPILTLTLMIVPARPSRENVISIPGRGRKLCGRLRRPQSARRIGLP
jgi:hypothetical protein